MFDVNDFIITIKGFMDRKLDKNHIYIPSHIMRESLRFKSTFK